ncbi:MAG: sulfotransferase [Pseudomonadales bacterium]
MKLFFAGGFNKSGTTYLQMLLDSHPAINCPSEQHLNTLIDGLKELGKKYDSTTRVIDNATARQGTRFNYNAFVNNTLKSMLSTLASSGANAETQYIGIQDNSILDRFEYWNKLMPDSPHIFIVRDPRAVCYSIWKHRLRTEPSFAEANSPLEPMMELMAKVDWPRHCRRLQGLKEIAPEKVHIVRYEDLAGEHADEWLAEIFDFLKVPHSNAEIDEILIKNDFHTLQAQQAKSGGQYMHSGVKQLWRKAASEKILGFFEQHCRQELDAWGYE